MNTYDDGLTITYSLASADYGASDFDHGAIPVPAGFTMCRIDQVGVTALAEVFVGTTSTPGIKFGIVGTLAKFAEMDFGAIAEGDSNSLGASAAEGGVDNNYGGPGVILCSSDGENISQIEVTGVAAVGSPTGQAITHITLTWW